MVGMIEQAGQKLNPEQIKQVKDGYKIARSLIYQEKVFAGLVKDVQGNPTRALASAVVMVMQRVQESVGNLDLMTAAALGLAVLDDVAGALEEAGLIENAPELQLQAFQEATTIWLRSNDYNDEEIAQAFGEAGGDTEQLKQAIAQRGQQQAPAGTPAPSPPVGAQPPPQSAPQSGIIQRSM